MIKLEKEILSDKVKKNLLDLEYNKNLQYQLICIITVITYIVGLAIAFITKQIDYRNSSHLLAVFFGSFAFVGFMAIPLNKFRIRLKKILAEIKQLKL